MRPQGLQEHNCLRSLQRPSEGRRAPFSCCRAPEERLVFALVLRYRQPRRRSENHAQGVEGAQPAPDTDLGGAGEGPSGLKPQQPTTMVSRLLHRAEDNSRKDHGTNPPTFYLLSLRCFWTLSLHPDLEQCWFRAYGAPLERDILGLHCTLSSGFCLLFDRSKAGD